MLLSNVLLAFAALLPSALSDSSPSGQKNLGVQLMGATGPDGLPDPKIGNPFIYSSKLHFDQPVYANIFDAPDQAGKDAQLSGIARDAYYEMSTAPAFVNGDRRVRPFAMAALAVGNDIYISSSLKGPAFVYKAQDTNNPAYTALYECQVAFEKIKDDTAATDEHKNNAACAEIMTIYAYYQENPQGSLTGATIATVKNRNPSDFTRIENFPPCGTDQNDNSQPLYWGCSQFLQSLGINGVTAPAFGEVKLPDSMQISQVVIDCKPAS